MKVYCEECQCLVGDIRDASIRKNTTYFCGDCNGKNEWNTEEPGKNEPRFTDEYALDMLKNMFGLKA